MLWNICLKIFIKIIRLVPHKNQVSLKYFGYLSHDRHIIQSVTGTDMILVYKSSYFRKFRTDRKFYHLRWNISSASRTCLSQYYIHFHFKLIRWFQEDFKHLLWWRWCWWHRYVGDLKKVTICGCWWPKRPKPSPTSKSCHQHISSPTSVTNVDVTFTPVLFL